MNDYEVGICYATGCFAKENGKKYLIVRNLDRWYPETISKVAGNKAYESHHNIDRDGKPQWAVKARIVHELPPLHCLDNLQNFCRAYIEIHGVLDIQHIDNASRSYDRLRLRIYGDEKILSFLNTILPATPKKIQHIKNRVDGKYTGKTCALHYQSRREVQEILRWIDGEQKNQSIWERWEDVLSQLI